MYKGNMNLHEVADLIERFLDKNPKYPMEWNNFVDTSQENWIVNAYRKCCYELDPLISHLGEPCPGVVATLRAIAKALRETDISHMPIVEKKPAKTGKYWIVALTLLIALALTLKYL